MASSKWPKVVLVVKPHAIGKCLFMWLVNVRTMIGDKGPTPHR